MFRILLIILIILVTAGCGFGNSGGADLGRSHDACQASEECVPMPGCHVHECINQEFVDNYDAPEFCTMIFDPCAAYNASDCECRDGKCVNKNLEKEECGG